MGGGREGGRLERARDRQADRDRKRKAHAVSIYYSHCVRISCGKEVLAASCQKTRRRDCRFELLDHFTLQWATSILGFKLYYCGGHNAEQRKVPLPFSSGILIPVCDLPSGKRMLNQIYKPTNRIDQQNKKAKTKTNKTNEQTNKQNKANPV